MFLINKDGRTVDVPAQMEESGFHQAREVLSISSALMEGITAGIAMNEADTQKLKIAILAKFPNVITDEEYLITHPREVLEAKEEKSDDIEFNMGMTKQQLIDTAIENGVQLSKQEEKLSKTKLIEIINERR